MVEVGLTYESTPKRCIHGSVDISLINMHNIERISCLSTVLLKIIPMQFAAIVHSRANFCVDFGKD